MRKNLKDYKIITVNSSEDMLESISYILKDYTIEGYTDPQDALEAIYSNNYDLLILDSMLPGYKFDHIVQTIRQFDKDLYILLIVSEILRNPPDIETMQKLDIQGYCLKGGGTDMSSQLRLSVGSGLRSVDMMKTITKNKNSLNKILEVIPQIYQLLPVEDIMQESLKGITQLVESENAFILVDDFRGSSTGKSIFKGLGRYDLSLEQFSRLMTTELIDFGKKGVNTLAHIIGYVREVALTLASDNSIVLPLTNEAGRVIGIIFIESWGFRNEIRLLELFAKQATTSISNAFLHFTINMQEEELRETYAKLQDNYQETIEILRLTVDAKDKYTRGHSDRVKFYALKIGKEMGLSEYDLKLLSLAGLFHDIGKIGTGDEILKKEGKLTQEERMEIQKHPLLGSLILSTISGFREVVPIVKHHHERVDGKGYPSQLSDQEIPLLAKVIAAADAFDAMTTDRSYRQKMSFTAAKTQLIDNRGTQFDSVVISYFLRALDHYDEWQEELVRTFELASQI